jgi:hypothetical protein
MTPEEMLIRAEVALEWREALKEAVAAAYEDAAKIAEGTNWEGMGRGWRTRDRIAAAIRARIEDAK